MIKEITKVEALTTKTDVTYYKVYFGNQWFMVTPWHYSKAKLMDVFDLVKLCKVGEQYDIKWRVANVGNNKVTFLTSFIKSVEEFSWDGDEQGVGESGNSPTSTTQALSQEYSNKVSNHKPKPIGLPVEPYSEDDGFDFDHPF